HISRDTRQHGVANGGIVALVHEHGDRALHQAADLEHLLQDVAVGAPQIDDDDFRVDGDDLRQEIAGAAEPTDIEMPGLTQAFFYDGGTRGILIDDQYFGLIDHAICANPCAPEL